jgi:hypothetical protein
MTVRQGRWTKADQERLEAALSLDAESNIAFARLAPRTQRTCWSRAGDHGSRQAVARPETTG